MITALLYKDVTARILQVACVLAVCWVILVYTVAALPISLDTSGANPLDAESSMTLASQATIIVTAVLAHIELSSGESTMAAIIAGSRRRMAIALVASKTIILLVFVLFLTFADIVGNMLVYGSGSILALVFQYTALAAMNGIAVLSLSSVAGNVLLGLSVYFLTPILLKPFIISLAPSTNGLFYSAAIQSISNDTSALTDLFTLAGWAFALLLVEYMADQHQENTRNI